MNVSDPIIRQEVMKEIKVAILDNEDCIKRSEKNPDRYIVTLHDGSHVILVKDQKKVKGKAVFVPVTWLSPHMNPK